MMKGFGFLLILVAALALLVGGMSALAGHGGPLDDSGPSILAQSGVDEGEGDVGNDGDARDVDDGSVDDDDTGASEDVDDGSVDDDDTGASEDVDDGEVDDDDTGASEDDDDGEVEVEETR